MGHFCSRLLLSLEDDDCLLIPALACCNKKSKSVTGFFPLTELFMLDIESSSSKLKCLELSLGLRSRPGGAESETQMKHYYLSHMQ